MDNPTMELSSYSNKARKTDEHFRQMLSQGKGVSVFEAVRQARLGTLEISFTDPTLLNAKDIDGFTILHHAARCNHPEAVDILLNSSVDIDLVETSGFTALHIAVRHRNTEVVKALLERGADPSIPDNENATPLLFASRRGYVEIATLLLNDPRTNVNHANLAQITPFHAACTNGNRSMCELLLAHGAELTAKSSNLTTALHCAALNGNVEICELLISTAKKSSRPLKAFLEERDVEDSTALHMSCLKGYSGVTELLLRHGADYNALKGVTFSSPLHLAVTHGHEEITRLLISSGAMIECRDGHLQTPLHRAAIFDRVEIAEILLENGAEIEARNMMDLTPFLMSVIHGAKETAGKMLDHGANLMVTDSERNSCLHLAVLNRRIETLRMLLVRGRKWKLMELRNNELKSVIHLAACYNEKEILDILLDESFSADQRDINDKIPLHLAAENGSLECIDSLLRCKTLLKSMNDRDNHGMTALHLAALNKHTEACRRLISNGSVIASQNYHQCTPLHLAVEAGSLETVRLLKNPMLPCTLEIKNAEQNTPLHVACKHNRLDVLRFLLDKGADVTARNKDGMTCLEVAIEWDSLEVAKTLVKHKRWKEVISTPSKDKIPPMNKLIAKLPEVAEIVLDQCISYSPLPTSHPDFTVTYTFFPIELPPDDSSNGSSFFGPACMATHRKESLLNHLVTQMLLRWKWMVLGKSINYFNFAFFLVFLVLFSYFVVDQRYKVRLSFGSEVDTTAVIPGEESKAIATVIFTLLILNILKEIFQVGWLQRNYFKDYTNFVDLTLYSSAMIYILPYVTNNHLYGDAQVQWSFGALALLLCYVNCILFLRRLSSPIAIYVTMYFEVLATFLKVMASFTIVGVGYALVFFLLLKEQDDFSSVWLSFVKINLMSVGELDYSNILSRNVVDNAKVPGTNIQYVPLPQLSYVMFILFVVSVSIVLMNLLVGLAVGDIDSIQRTASLRALIEQALLVDNLQRTYPKWILRRVYKSSMEIKPNQNTFIKNLALSGSSFNDGQFMEALRKKQFSLADDEGDLGNYDQQRFERQEERIRNLQATVDAQSDLLRDIADKLQIGKYTTRL